MDAANVGVNGTGYQGGIKAIQYPQVTAVPDGGISSGGHSAIIIMNEACWWSDYSATFSVDSGAIIESGSVMITDVHDFSSIYGEFLQTGNDAITQLGSIRFGNSLTGGSGYIG